MSVAFDSANLKFPARWHGSLVVAGTATGTEGGIRQVMAGLGLADYETQAGRVSAGGRYATWKISCLVPDLQTLRALFTALEGLPDVRMLI